MARRTPPVAVQVLPAMYDSIAYYKARLIDFDTAAATLEAQHIAWLSTTMAKVKPNSAYRIRLVGYASKLGNPNYNMGLSRSRMQAVLGFMQTLDTRALTSLENFYALGESESTGSEDDNAANWRAVEAHIFIGDVPPPPPPPDHTRLDPPKPMPLPGGDRFTDWAVATPGGVLVTEVIGGGFNVFFIKNKKLSEVRGYFQPIAGVGGSISLSGLKGVWAIVQQIITGIQLSGIDYIDVTSRHATSWEEMEGCLVRVTSASAGFIKGAGIAIITFSSSGVWQYGPSGFPLRIAEDLFQFQAPGEDWQLGVGASTVVGPLFRVGG